MKTLTAGVTALTVLAFGSTAYACMGNYEKPVDQTAETPILVLPGTTAES